MALDKLRIHKKLLTTISDEFDKSSAEYRNFVEHMKGYIGRGLLSEKKDLLDKFDAMEIKKHLKVGYYEVLKKISRDSGCLFVLDFIETAEREIQALGDIDTANVSNQTTDKKQSTSKRSVQEIVEERNNIRASTTGPLTSRQPQAQTLPVQETIYERNNIPTPTTEPSTSRQPQAQTRPVQEIVNDGAGTAKRPRTEVDSSDPLYNTDHEGHGYYDNTGKTGLLLILNSKEDRKGTEKDVEKLKAFFGINGLRFDVFDPREHEKEDLTTDEVDDVLNAARARLNDCLGTHYYCFICVIMSHGNEDGVKTRNGLKSIDEIHRFFNNKNMPKFAGRPKVFFIQACRGSEQHDSQEIDDADDEKRPEAGQNGNVDEADEIIRIPTDADTLLAYATTPGYKSFRRLGVGSWFITECMDVFEKYRKKDHLEDMLITVREKVALHWTKQDGAKQMPCVWSTLTKRLKLT